MELHACTAKIHAGGSTCSSLPVRLDHPFFTCRFCLQCLFLFLLLYFHMYKPQTTFFNVCAQLISLRNEHFFGDTFGCAVFSFVQTLKTSLCWAFYWRKPCHDHTFDLLCFHMYKPQSNLNSRQRRQPTVAARRKRN